MDYIKYLKATGVPEALHADAVERLEEARKRARGLLWHKIVSRFIKAPKMARLVVDNKATRASAVDPDFDSYDVEPVLNINAFGDNAKWVDGRPLNATPFGLDPGTPEYQAEVNWNYWNKGQFTGTYGSVLAWYRRNGGAAEAYARGAVVFPEQCKSWEANGVKVCYSLAAWQVDAKDKWLGFIPVKVRIGYEISNAVNIEKQTPNWVPFVGRPLRAPVTWSVIPGKG